MPDIVPQRLLAMAIALMILQPYSSRLPDPPPERPARADPDPNEGAAAASRAPTPLPALPEARQ